MTVHDDRMLRSGILVLVFVFAGLGAAGTEWLRARRAARWSASAELTLPEEWLKIIRGGQNASTPLDPHTVVEEALAALDPNRPGDSPSSEEPPGPARTSATMPLTGKSESARRDLRATVDRPGGQVVRIGFRFSASSADRAVRELNDVVGAYAARLRMAVAREVLRRAATVRTADERFDRELGTVGPELDRLVDRAVKLAAYRSASKNATAGVEKASGSPFREEPTEKARTSTEHRQGTEAQTKLEEFGQRRAQLLLDRTPAHPDVRHIETLIAEAEKHLEEPPPPATQATEDVPREPPKRTMEAPPAPEESRHAPAPSAPNSAQWTEMFQAIQGLQGRIEGIHRELERTRGHEIPGEESLIRGEDMGIRWAERAEMVTAHVQWQALVLVALAAGLVAAAGVAMVWAGVQIDSPVASGRSIERGLTLPVIGAIAVDQVLPESASSRSVRARWKRPCIVGGLAVVAAYFAFLLQPFLAG